MQKKKLACFLRRGGSDSPALLMKRKTAHAQKLTPWKHPEGFQKRNRKPTSSDTIPCTPFAFRKDPEGFQKKNQKGNKPRTKLASRKLPEAQPEELLEGNRHAPGLFQRFCLGQPCCVSSFTHLYVPYSFGSGCGPGPGSGSGSGSGCGWSWLWLWLWLAVAAAVVAA